MSSPCRLNDNLVLGAHLGEVLIVGRIINKHKRKGGGKNDKESELSQSRSLHLFTSAPIRPTQPMSHLHLAINSSPDKLAVSIAYSKPR